VAKTQIVFSEGFNFIPRTHTVTDSAERTSDASSSRSTVSRPSENRARADALWEGLRRERWRKLSWRNVIEFFELMAKMRRAREFQLGRDPPGLRTSGEDLLGRKSIPTDPFTWRATKLLGKKPLHLAKRNATQSCHSRRTKRPFPSDRLPIHAEKLCAHGRYGLIFASSAFLWLCSTPAASLQ
jgi:hypothetical protein